MSSGTRAVSVVLVGITHHDWQGRQLQKSHRPLERSLRVKREILVHVLEVDRCLIATAATTAWLLCRIAAWIRRR
jgi:hypothetical protein